MKKKVLKTGCKGSLLSQKKASTQTPLADAMQLQESKTERVSFSAILDRLKAAKNTGEAVPLSPMEVKRFRFLQWRFARFITSFNP